MDQRIDQESGRHFLKDSIRMVTDFSKTGQGCGLPPPPVEKPFDPSARRVALPKPGQWKNIKPISVEEAIGRRESRRKFSKAPLTLDELTFLLWSTQGIRRKLASGIALRTVPSAGARHAFETYLGVLNVTGLEPGLYRYLPIEHELLFERAVKNLDAELATAALGQEFADSAAVTFVWTTLPARMEWRYGDASYKVIAVDAGHMGQNLYLACEVIGAGTCAIGAYDQDAMDRLLGVDGKDEFTVYVSPVGKVPA